MGSSSTLETWQVSGQQIVNLLHRRGEYLSKNFGLVQGQQQRLHQPFFPLRIPAKIRCKILPQKARNHDIRDKKARKGDIRDKKKNSVIATLPDSRQKSA